MSTYKRLRKLSNERLADTNVYRPIDHVKDLTVENLGERSAYLTGGYVPLPQGEGLTYADRNRELLKTAGVVAVRNALVGFGYFDGRYARMRALPMYADYEGRQERTMNGSYHTAIWNDYYDRRLSKKGKGGFRTAGGIDAISGEAILLADEEKPIVYLRMPRGKSLSPAHIGALAEASAVFPAAKYVISTRGLSEFTAFNEGTVEELEY